MEIITVLPPIGIACTAIAAATISLAIAKRKTPITRKDADILWKLHKQTTHCTSRKWQPQTDELGKITGFQCQCGYSYTQKRPLLSKTH